MRVEKQIKRWNQPDVDYFWEDQQSWQITSLNDQENTREDANKNVNKSGTL